MSTELKRLSAMLANSLQLQKLEMHYRLKSQTKEYTKQLKITVCFNKTVELNNAEA